MYDFDLPDGVSVADFKRHPLVEAIREAAYHGAKAVPSKRQLDGLDLPSADRRRIREACEEVAAIHDTGHHQNAWKAGDRAAAEVFKRLPEDQRDPDFHKPPEPLIDDMSPRDLAAQVPRM